MGPNAKAQKGKGCMQTGRASEWVHLGTVVRGLCRELAGVALLLSLPTSCHQVHSMRVSATVSHAHTEGSA